MSEAIMTPSGVVCIGKAVVTINMNADVVMPNGLTANLSRTWAHASNEGTAWALAKAMEVFKREWDLNLERVAEANIKGIDPHGSRLFYEDDDPWTLGEDEWYGAVFDAEGNLWAHMSDWPNDQFLSPQGNGVKEYGELDFPVSLAHASWVQDI